MPPMMLSPVSMRTCCSCFTAVMKKKRGGGERGVRWRLGEVDGVGRRAMVQEDVFTCVCVCMRSLPATRIRVGGGGGGGGAGAAKV